MNERDLFSEVVLAIARCIECSDLYRARQTAIDNIDLVRNYSGLTIVTEDDEYTLSMGPRENTFYFERKSGGNFNF